MGTARRLYLYVVSLVSLLAFTGGIGSLLQLVLQRAEQATGTVSVLGGDISSGQAALSIAMIAVGAPVWGLHWWLVRRGMRSSSTDGDEDRASAVRAWYLAIVMGIALAASVMALEALVTVVVASALGVRPDLTWPLPLAVAMVALPTWATHARMRWLELRTTRMRGAAAWATRLYRYLAAYAVLLILLTGAAGLIETILSVLVGRAEFEAGGTWWRLVAAGQVSSIAVGLGAWFIHWQDAGTAIRDAAQIGEDDRVTRLRAAFFGGALLTAIAWVAMGVAGAIASAGRLLTGMSPASTAAWLEDVVGPPVVLLPFAVAATWLIVGVRREAVGVGPLQVLAARRLTALLPSLAGLAFLAAGVIQLVETGLVRLGGGPEPILYGQDVNVEVPWYVAQVVVGLALWLPAWAAVLSGRQREPDLERTAAASRGYLFLVVGTAIVAAVPATIVILFRVLDPLLGGASSAGMLPDVAFPIAVLLVAIVAGGYHARILLGDLALRVPAARTAPDLLPASPGPIVPADAVPGDRGHEPGMEHVATVELVLEVPEGEDAPAVVDGLRSHLPPGVLLRVRPVG